MKQPMKCLWCESERIESGKIMAMGGTAVFRPNNVKFWTLSEGAVPLEARVCLECGYVDIYASPKKLKKIVDEF
jgi:predicted nucleic-acid-binding Zn-ribbon protein